MRRAIRSCPWVLSEWETDVVRLARESRGLPDLGPETPSVRQGLFQPTDGEVPPFLQPPRFRWEPPGLPVFACSSADPDTLGLDAGSYQVRFGEEVLGSLFRQPGGHYLADRPEVLLPFTSPRPIVMLTDVAGCSVATQAFDLWNPTADVTVLRAKSEKAAEDLSAKALKPSHSYVLLTASDLIVEPSQTVWRRLGHQNAQRLTLIPRDWPPDLRVVDRGGTLLWQPRLSQQLAVRGA